MFLVLYTTIYVYYLSLSLSCSRWLSPSYTSISKYKSIPKMNDDPKKMQQNKILIKLKSQNYKIIIQMIGS